MNNLFDISKTLLRWYSFKKNKIKILSMFKKPNSKRTIFSVEVFKKGILDKQFFYENRKDAICVYNLIK